MIKKLYPQGKPKAFVVTYDDGVLQDRPFVALLNRYGLKGTFNLNSGLMESEFEWTHENGCVIKRLSPQSAAPLYQGHEVACHSLTHPYMEHLGEETLMAELRTEQWKEWLIYLLYREDTAVGYICAKDGEIFSLGYLNDIFDQPAYKALVTAVLRDFKAAGYRNMTFFNDEEISPPRWILAFPVPVNMFCLSKAYRFKETVSALTAGVRYTAGTSTGPAAYLRSRE